VHGLDQLFLAIRKLFQKSGFEDMTLETGACWEVQTITHDSILAEETLQQLKSAWDRGGPTRFGATAG
jgi:hypothetical protein